MKHTISDRGLRALNLKEYDFPNPPEHVGKLEVKVPDEKQYVLRCLVKKPFEDYKVPDFLRWLTPLLEKADDYQRNTLKIVQPFCYVTVRSGFVDSHTDDEWHVDGFSQVITHLPEQNYVWSNLHPTEYVSKPFNFPSDFDTLKHNLHLFFQDNITEKDEIHVCEPNTLYCMDPYVVHRRTPKSKGSVRTFVRFSYTPIEIADINNTLNPLIETNYTRDGIKSFRDSLTRYSK